MKQYRPNPPDSAGEKDSSISHPKLRYVLKLVQLNGVPMVFLLDESNIHSQEGITSIVLIHLANLEQLAALDAHVEAVEKSLGIRQPFHWWKSNWRVREAFIRELLRFDFRVRVALVDNPTEIEEALEHTLPYLISEPEVQRLIIDGSRPRTYSSQLKRVLRSKNITVKKLRTESDHARPSLRVADAVAGLVRHHAEEPAGKGASLYRRIESRIDVALTPQKMPRRNWRGQRTR